MPISRTTRPRAKEKSREVGAEGTRRLRRARSSSSAFACTDAAGQTSWKTPASFRSDTKTGRPRRRRGVAPHIEPDDGGDESEVDDDDL